MSKIPELKLSKKGNELVNFYKLMVGDGYKNDNFNEITETILMSNRRR